MRSTESWNVGAAEVDITPPVGGPMLGLRRRRDSDSVHDPLLTKAIVIERNGAAIALCACDLAWVPREVVCIARELIAARCDLPPSAILIAATHTHTGPSVPPSLAPNEADDEYSRSLPELVCRAVQTAWNRREQAALAVGSVMEPGATFNRRAAWRAQRGLPRRDELLTVLRDRKRPAPIDVAQERIAAEQEAVDPELGLLLARRLPAAGVPSTREPAAGPPATGAPLAGPLSSEPQKPGQPFAALLNYGTHVTTVGGATCLSADFPAIIAEGLRHEYGQSFRSLYTSGAAGDVNVFDGQRDSNDDGFETATRVANLLTRRAVELAGSLDTLLEVKVACASRMLTLNCRQPTADHIAAARRVIEELAGKDEKALWHAHETLDLAEAPATLEVEVQVLQAGDAAFVGLPGEIFHELGLAIKDRSPFPSTFVVELANGYAGYIPTAEAFEQGGYETILSRGSFLEPGAGIKIVEEAVDLLVEVYQGT